MAHPAYHLVLHHLDAWAAALLLPLTAWLLLSGLDDLFVDLVLLLHRVPRLFRRAAPSSLPPLDTLRAQPQRRLAIFVPLWHEHAVISRMLTRNIGAIDYDRYDFFVGAYPNDHLTLDAIREVEARQPRVHLALCPHNGPTSKADCLNWIYQRMLLYEEQHGVRFDVVITHDAEDLIHPLALLALNYYAPDYDMVQVPVLALPTPPLELVHGLYCDEFAEFQLRDQQARLLMNAFLPSNGVGTGYTRRALELLASGSHNHIFDPTSLTEDYENGLRLYELRCRQIFLPLARLADDFVATREYFPQGFQAAIRQRTRWITGIALQGWERHGWRGRVSQVYWYWRDRKGLVGHPATLLANLLFLYGLGSAALSSVIGEIWQLPEAVGKQAPLLIVNLVLQLLRLGFRFHYVRQIYGWRFACASPLHSLICNVINCWATLAALQRYGRARLLKQPLVWLKTSHAYPNRHALQVSSTRPLGELLVAAGHLAAADLASALRTQPAGVRLGEYLQRLNLTSEDAVYEALSQQQGWPIEPLEFTDVDPAARRSLPRALTTRFHILPFRVRAGHLHIAGPELPGAELHAMLQKHTQLPIQFRWITPSNFERLRPVEAAMPESLESPAHAHP